MTRDRIAIIAAFVFAGAFTSAVALPHWITFGVQVTTLKLVNLS